MDMEAKQKKEEKKEKRKKTKERAEKKPFCQSQGGCNQAFLMDLIEDVDEELRMM